MLVFDVRTIREYTKALMAWGIVWLYRIVEKHLELGRRKQWERAINNFAGSVVLDRSPRRSPEVSKVGREDNSEPLQKSCNGHSEGFQYR